MSCFSQFNEAYAQGGLFVALLVSPVRPSPPPDLSSVQKIFSLDNSKNCHIKNFGTKDLRHANLPNRDQVMGLSPPTSPSRNTRGLDSPPSSPPRPTPGSIEATIAGRSFTMSPPKLPFVTKPEVTGDAKLRTGGGRIGVNDLPGRSPLSPTKHRGNDHVVDESADRVDEPRRPRMGETMGAVTLGRNDVVAPLVQTATGTRYGRGLTGVGGGTNRQWGGGTPVCPKCGKLVYFAEQVSGQREISISDQKLTFTKTKAIGQTFHKGCLRCSECDSRLGPGRLSERDARPYCHRCYAKVRCFLSPLREMNWWSNTYDSCTAHRGADTRYSEVKVPGEEGESEPELFSPIQSIRILRRQCQT